MTLRSALFTAAGESVPDGPTIVLITAVGLGIILMLIMVIGRRYRRMVLGDGGRDAKRKRDETADAWSESARRIRMSDGDADAGE